jgi:hypothetical protein
MPRVAAILAIGGGLILISWVTAPAARPAANDPRLPAAEIDRAEQTSRAVTPLASEIDAETARLRARLAQAPPKPQPDRNPFKFGAPTRPTSRPVGPTVAVGRSELEGRRNDAPAIVPVAPAVLMPTLVAITSDARDGGLLRTAVLSMNDDMKIVQPGQMFDRFLVEAIGPDSVRIADITSPSRATFTIAIR